MSRQQVLPSVITALLVALFLIGCGSPTSTPIAQAPATTPTPTTGTVEGTITQDGIPVNEIVIGLSPTQKEGATPTPGPKRASQETKTDSNGKYIFNDVLPGDYFVTLVVVVTDTDRKCIVTEPVTVQAGKQIKTDFSIPKEINASIGIATLPDGKVAFCVKR